MISIRQLRPAGDDGAATVEFLGVSVLVILLTFTPIQVAAFVHARNLATAAAQDAAHAAARADLTTGEAEAAGVLAARRILDGERSITDVSVHVTRDPQVATATVTGMSLTILPGVRWQAHATQQAGVERFVGRTQP